MAEIDLDSSHNPGRRSPAWCRGTSSATARSTAGCTPPHVDPAVLSDPHLQQASYARSIRYSLRSLVSFVRHAHDPNLVMVVLGDHQPNSLVSGTGVSHDVPVSLVAHDPQVLQQIDGWGWTPGLQPTRDGVQWPMDAFRDRFLAGLRLDAVDAVASALAAAAP